MKLLQKIEKTIEMQNKSFNSLSETFDRLEKKIETNFNEIQDKKIDVIFDKISSRLDLINTEKVKDLNVELNEISKNIQNNFQFKSVSLLNRVINLNLNRPKPSKPRTPSFTSGFQNKTPISRSVSHLRSKKSESDLEVEAPQGDWTSLELEGAEIFEKVITGWKRRDLEKADGNKEMFMRAWKKLSSYDRSAIKNGAWSKKLINKIKMLGRS
jgi:hypothetical protein